MPLCRERIEGRKKIKSNFALLCIAAEFLFRFDLLRDRADGQGGRCPGRQMVRE
jgi:hypothetical protein